MLTVLCWYWTQPGVRTAYEPLHVQIWADMISRHLSVPHRLACVTDEPIDIEGVEIIKPPKELEAVRIPSWPEYRPQCLRRLVMFRPDAGEIFGDEILCFDLDCVVGASLDPLVDALPDFKMAIGTAPSRPYNGSLLYLRAGSRPEVYQRFTPEGAAEAGKLFVGSDQAWIAHCLGPDEATWGEADGLTYHGLHQSRSRIEFYPGSTKPWHNLNDPWVGQHYRRSPQGRCLILGYGDTLWDDVNRAIDDGPYDAVIASPEAAEHWPGGLFAIARDNAQAARMARFHGFEATWCGIEKEAA